MISGDDRPEQLPNTDVYRQMSTQEEHGCGGTDERR